MNPKSTLLTLAIVMSGLVGGAYLTFNNSKTTPSISENSIAQTDSTSFDWGDIGIDDGDVSHKFEIKNEGQDSLKLFNITTSCMCTNAQLITDNQKSPIFDMHSDSSYILELQPNESAKLNVTFAPDYHGPEGVGPITRIVTVETNDTNNQELNFTLTALVRKGSQK